MARVTRAVASIVTPILAVLALGACGDGTATKDRNAYAQQVNAAQTKFASTVTSVSQRVGPKSSVTQQQRTLRRFETAIGGVVGELSRIDAPSEVTEEHEQLIAVMSGFGDDIGQANEVLRNPTPRTIELAERRVATATQSVNSRVDAAIAAINAKLREK